MCSAAGMHMLSGLYELLIKKKKVQRVTHIWPTTCAIQNKARDYNLLMHTIAHLSPCVHVSVCSRLGPVIARAGWGDKTSSPV